MSTILIYDYDFYHYPNIIPNLECAKYAAWRKNKKDIVLSLDTFEPSNYSSVFFRKEYDDGIYDPKILLPNVNYGGRAFSEHYQPFDLEMERIKPDFSIYNKYINHYGSTKKKQEELKTLLYATHMRASLDEKKLETFPLERLERAHPIIIFHDYNLSKIPNIYEYLEDIVYQPNKTYRIGNKYPINVYNYEELKKWLALPGMSAAYCIQYNGLFSEEEIIDFSSRKLSNIKSIIYNFAYGFKDEDDFLSNGFIDFYKQTLFLRNNQMKILLNIDNFFFKTEAFLNLMNLINIFYQQRIITDLEVKKQTLFGYCAWQTKISKRPYDKRCISITPDQMRESFQFIRKNNYEAFDMFYSYTNVIAKGGKLQNGWN